MDEFGRWVKQHIDETGALGEFARLIAVEPRWPVAHTPDDDYFDYYSQLNRLGLDKHLHLFNWAWRCFTGHMLDDRALPALPGEGEPVEETYDCLVAVLEGGTMEQLIPLLLAVELSPRQRGELIARAEEVTRRFNGSDIHSNDPARPWQTLCQRYSRMLFTGLACHSDPADAAAWMTRKAASWMTRTVGAAYAFDVVGHRDATWLRVFTRCLAEGERADLHYPLLASLARDKGVPVQPQPRLAHGCVFHHAEDAKDPASAAEEATVTRLRQDPLALTVLPGITEEHRITEHHLGSATGSVPYREAQVLAVAAKAGVLDRATLIADVADALLSSDPRRHAVDGYVALMEYLAPTETEFAPYHKRWVTLLASVPTMRKLLLVRAAEALSRQGRFPSRVVDEWIEVIGKLRSVPPGPEMAHVRTATAGLVALKGARGCISDKQVAAVLRLVATAPGPRASAAMVVLKSFAAAGRLPIAQVAECAREVLFRPEKSVVTAAIAFLNQVLRMEPGWAGVLVPLLADAFCHASPDVQEKALNLAEKHAAALNTAHQRSLATAAEQLIPALRTRALRVFGDETYPSPGHAVEEAPLEVPDREPFPAPIDTVAGAVEELAVVLRARVPDPVECERAMDALVRCAHRDRTGFATDLEPLLQSFGLQSPDLGADLAEVAKPLMAAVALVESVAPHGPGRVSDEVIAARTAVFPVDLEHARVRQGRPCGHDVFDRVMHARWAEVIGRLRDRETTPFLLATPSRANGVIGAGELVERLAAYHRLGASPGRRDLEQSLLRVALDADAEQAGIAATALGTPEALRLASWLRDGGMALPETVRTPLEPWQPETPYGAEEAEPWRLRAAIPDFADRLDGFCDPFRDLVGPYVADRDHCGVLNAAGAWPRLMLHWLMVLPRHRELVAARTLTAFAEGAESSRRSAAVHLPALADAEGAAGTAVRLALAHGLGANRAEERVAASDAFLILAARQDLDEEQFGHDLAELVVGRVLKVSRLVESLTVAAQGGAHHNVAVVLASLLGGRLDDDTVAWSGLGKLLTLAAECAERSGRPLPPVDGLAELAARSGSGVTVKSARRLWDALALVGSV
ncbi:DUF6493 family protein [Streptomyces sp. NPDC057101]|uniref:DUF7824 domain-containing protein n=1 Tax=Streptomyces sp. NPDC057101 TaxID=3346020 RepID=UPI0036455135